MTVPVPEPQPLVSVFVPGKPVSTNRLYGTARGSTRRFLTPAAVDWRTAVWAASVPLRTVCQAAAWPLRIRCTFYGVRGDADNYLKSTLDGVKLGILVDDRHYNPVEAHVRAADMRGQGCQIDIYAFDANTPINTNNDTNNDNDTDNNTDTQENTEPVKTRTIRPIPVRRPRRKRVEPLTLRPFVVAFAHAMERELRAHDAAKTGWLDVDPNRLLNLMRGEERELDAALLIWQTWRDEAHAYEVLSEASDVACYAAMLAHCVGGLFITEPVDERGRAVAASPSVPLPATAAEDVPDDDSIMTVLRG